MGRSGSEDPQLAEVKAILARLQRIAPDDEPLPPEAAAENIVRLPLPAQAPPVAGEPTTAAIEAPQPSSRRWRALLLAGCATAATLLIAIPSMQQPPAPLGTTDRVAAAPAAPAPLAPQPEATAVTPPAATPVLVVTALPAADAGEKAQLRQADELIRSGRLAAGRATLRRFADDGSADAAWALARSYDPNFIAAIENADAAADVDEATKWYRRWQGLAVAQGLVADSVSIDRMIRAMRP